MKTSLYNGEIELDFDEPKHLYSVDGEPVDGITGVLKVISKPALMFWAVNCSIDYIRDNLKPGEAVDEVQIEDLLKEAKIAHTRKSSSAADMGTMIHDWIAAHLRGEKPKLPVNPKLRKSVEAFLQFEKDHELKPLAIERMVYSIRHNFAGRPDVIGKIDGESVIIDIKTGSVVHPEHFIQLGGYTIAFEEEFSTPIKRQIIINCSKDGELQIVSNEDIERTVEENGEAFVDALLLYRGLNKISWNLKGVLNGRKQKKTEGDGDSEVRPRLLVEVGEDAKEAKLRRPRKSQGRHPKEVE